MTDKELKEYIRKHRVYIYRDDIRVYPYGDPDNDWIKLDTYRGLVKAAYYLSNDQVIGYVSISLEGNPRLRDKTSREGLLEQGTAYEDLRILTLSALNFLHGEFQMAKLEPRKKPKRRKARSSKLYLQTEKVKKRIENLDKYLKEVKDYKGKELLTKLIKDYYKERNIYRRQIELVEDLAGVGIAVDATSHDSMITIGRARENINEIHYMIHSKSPDLDKLRDKINTLRGQITFINNLLIGTQPLFRSARRKKEKIKISDIVRTVIYYYNLPIEKINVQVDIKEVGPPFVITSSEGVMLQVFINLMDNSIYWLKVNKTKKPRITVLIDGNKGYVIFADNGPGVEKKHVDYIFEPFFSTKGIQGRGLGLYVARQLTDKYEYDLYYVAKKSEQILSGANFRIDFFEQEE
jgi:C4-dicarboxylate-specific signal transduction histidine kinase